MRGISRQHRSNCLFMNICAGSVSDLHRILLCPMGRLLDQISSLNARMAKRYTLKQYWLLRITGGTKQPRLERLSPSRFLTQQPIQISWSLLTVMAPRTHSQVVDVLRLKYLAGSTVSTRTS